MQVGDRLLRAHLDPSRTRLVRTEELAGPAGTRPFDVSVSGGDHPRVCAVWVPRAERSAAPAQLRCYSDATTRAEVVDTGACGPPQYLGLAADGTHLVLSTRPRDRRGLGPDLCVGVLDGSAFHVTRRVPFGQVRPADDDSSPPTDVSGLAWVGHDSVLVGSAVDDDVNGSVQRLDLSAVPVRGWIEAPDLRDPRDGDRWPVVTSVRSSTEAGAVYVEQNDADQHSRAVALDPSTGRDTSVVAVSAPGRFLDQVSGGPHGVLYGTRERSGTRHRWYFAAPGQEHGHPLGGIPADADVVVAQS